MKNICTILFFTCYFVVFGCKSDPGKKAPEASAGKTTTTAVVETGLPKKYIVFYGNSLTAGYGLEDVGQGWVSIIERRLDSLNLIYKVVNAGVSGETTAGGKSRIDWVLSQQPVDVFVLELGANDALRGLPSEQAYLNLKAIIEQVKKEYPDARIILAGMEAPPNLGNKYTSDFRAVYRRLEKEYKLILVPFILDKVGGEVTLNQADGIHPNAAGNIIVAETMWSALKEVL